MGVEEIYNNHITEKMKIPASVYDTFIATINDLIATSYKTASLNDGGTPKEPTLTKELAKEIGCNLYDALTLSISDYQFSVHSVFCHQCPKVTFFNEKENENECCELGDVLFVYDEQNEKEGNALLLQAKKAKTKKFRVGKKEKKQLDLYKYWFEFSYQNQRFSTEKRKIERGDSFSGAQYLLMIPNYNNGDLYHCGLPNEIENESPKIFPLLAESLIKLMTGETGGKYDRSISDVAPVSDDWSRVIHDLLKIDDVVECYHTVKKQRQYRHFTNEDNYTARFLNTEYLRVNFKPSITYNAFGDVMDFVPILNTDKPKDCKKPFVIFHIYAEKKEEKSHNGKM